jgi:FkbM family methyltransferase
MIKSYKYGNISFPSENEYKKYFSKNELNTYQEYINDMVKKYHRSNTIIIDVGANVGLFSISFGKICKNCEIHSFEPVSRTFNILEKNIKINNLENIKLHKKALSDTNNFDIIQVDQNNLGASSINQDLHLMDKLKKLSKRKGILKEKIEKIRLDDMNFDNVSFIKVDIQEHEYFFLLGAQETLKKK